VDLWSQEQGQAELCTLLLEEILLTTDPRWIALFFRST